MCCITGLHTEQFIQREAPHVVKHWLFRYKYYDGTYIFLNICTIFIVHCTDVEAYVYIIIIFTSGRWLVRNMGLSPTWFQLFSEKNYTDVEEYLYIIIILMSERTNVLRHEQPYLFFHIYNHLCIL